MTESFEKWFGENYKPSLESAPDDEMLSRGFTHAMLRAFVQEVERRAKEKRPGVTYYKPALAAILFREAYNELIREFGLKKK